mmetsp:Transcript_158262/g.280527  ORF Transcript_158262/g.280527 Transcript_158262/m.280527 type:complete len:110 (+) Transcript_158262:234-563(+)
MKLYALLFGGEISRSSLAGFLLQLANPWSTLNKNMVRGKAGKIGDDYNLEGDGKAGKIGDDYNLEGDGMVHGGLLVVAPFGTRVTYQFAEESFGDIAPVEEVFAAATQA